MATVVQASPVVVGEPRRVSITQLGGEAMSSTFSTASDYRRVSTMGPLTSTAGEAPVTKAVSTRKVTIGPATYVTPARTPLTLPVDISRVDISRRPSVTMVPVRKGSSSADELNESSMGMAMSSTYSTASDYRRTSVMGPMTSAAGLASPEDNGPQVVKLLSTASAAGRRRASSMMSTVTGRRYSIPATPESRYYAGNVGGIGFGAQPLYAGGTVPSPLLAPAPAGTSPEGTPVLAPAAGPPSHPPGSLAAPAGLLAAPPLGPPPLAPAPALAAAPPPWMPPGAGMPLDVNAMQLPYGAYLQPTMNGGYVVQMAPQMPPQYMMAPGMPYMHAQQHHVPYAPHVVHQVVPCGARGPVTTIMLRNIPQRYNRDVLLEDMDARGFAAAYDFFYLPIDFSTTHSVGYAFINFISEEELARFKATYVGLKLSEDSPKVCEVCDAKVQGKAGNVEYYRNSTVMGMDEKYHPVVLESGVRLPFPKPTRPLGPVQRRPPRAGGRV